MPENNAHHEVLVVGGGNGGISVAARLRRRGVGDIAIIEPREHHLYQPLFSHVAGGTARASITVRPQRDVMPKGVEWIRGRTASIDPDAGAVTLEDGRLITYDHVILTEPPGPASCAGASQKPMYQACDYWRAKGVLDDIRVIMVVPTHSIYGIPAFDRELERNVAKYGIEVRTDSELAEVDAAASELRQRLDARGCRGHRQLEVRRRAAQADPGARRESRRRTGRPPAPLGVRRLCRLPVHGLALDRGVGGVRSARTARAHHPVLEEHVPREPAG